MVNLLRESGPDKAADRAWRLRQDLLATMKELRSVIEWFNGGDTSCGGLGPWGNEDSPG